MAPGDWGILRGMNIAVARLIAVALFALVGASAVWAQGETGDAPAPAAAAEGAPINAMCPVMPEEPVDPEFTEVYEGRVIGFCCRMCRGKFRKDPQAYLVNLTQLKDAGGEAETTPAAEAPAAPVEAEEEAAEPDAAPVVPAASGRERWVKWLGEFHMAATDLPIGLLLGGALAELLFMATRKERFRMAAGFCVCVGAIGAVAAAALGWMHGGWAVLGDDWVMAVHRWMGTVAALGAVVATAMLAKKQKPAGGEAGAAGAAASRRGYRLALFGTVALVMGAGFFGGAMVFGLDHYAW